MCLVCSSVVGVVVVVVVVGRGSYWLFESPAYKVAFHGVPCRAILCCGETSRVVREIVVVSVDSGLL